MSDKQKPLIGVNATYEEKNHSCYKVPVNYIHAIYNAGGIPLLFPCRADEQMLNSYLDCVDGMLFTGGADYPAELSGEKEHPEGSYMQNPRAETDLKLMKMTLKERNMPILGICAGHQLIALASGGKLIQHIETAKRHGQDEESEHEVEIIAGKELKSIFNKESFIVNSSHHQAVREDDFPPEFVITAKSTGDGVVEAIEGLGERFVLGVQWHPERIKNEEHTTQLFAYFIEKCKEYWRLEKG